MVYLNGLPIKALEEIEHLSTVDTLRKYMKIPNCDIP